MWSRENSDRRSSMMKLNFLNHLCKYFNLFGKMKFLDASSYETLT